MALCSPSYGEQVQLLPRQERPAGRLGTVCPVHRKHWQQESSRLLRAFPTLCLLPAHPASLEEPLSPRRNLPSPLALHRTAYQLPEPTMQTFLPAMVLLLASLSQRVWAPEYLTPPHVGAAKLRP